MRLVPGGGGQEFLDARFTADSGVLPRPVQEGLPGMGAPVQAQLLTVGHANGLRLSARQLEEHLHAVQEANNLPRTHDVTDGRL